MLCVCVSTIYTYNRVSVYLNDYNGHLLFLLANEYPASDMLCFFLNTIDENLTAVNRWNVDNIVGQMDF